MNSVNSIIDYIYLPLLKITYKKVKYHVYENENPQNVYEFSEDKKLDKFGGCQSEETTSDDVDIFSAMQGLGYSDREIRIAIRDTKFEDNLSFEDKIKTLLQKIAEVS